MKKMFVLPLMYALSQAQIAVAEDPATAAIPESEVEEIVVVGQRTLSSLRAKVVAAEDHFYDVFNELNDDDRYDIHCENFAPLGTRIKARRCVPRFVDDAQQEEALAFLEGRPVIPPSMVIGYRNDELRDLMKNLIQTNPELLKAIQEHYELKLELQAARDKYFD